MQKTAFIFFLFLLTFRLPAQDTLTRYLKTEPLQLLAAQLNSTLECNTGNRFFEFGAGFHFPAPWLKLISEGYTERLFYAEYGPELKLGYGIQKRRSSGINETHRYSLVANLSWRTCDNVWFWNGGLGGSSYNYSQRISQDIWQVRVGGRIGIRKERGRAINEFYFTAGVATGYARTVETGCNRTMFCLPADLPREIDSVFPGTGPFVWPWIRIGWYCGIRLRKV